jgi:hypothetical protein
MVLRDYVDVGPMGKRRLPLLSDDGEGQEDGEDDIDAEAEADNADDFDVDAFASAELDAD